MAVNSAGGASLGYVDVAALRPVEDRVDLDFLGIALLFVAHKLRLEDGELGLRFEYVLLRRAAHGVAHFGDPQDILQEFLVAVYEVDGGVGVVQFVVGLLQAGADIEADGEVLLVLGGGFFGRDLAAQLALAREGQFLGDHDSGVAGDVAAESRPRVGRAVGRVPERDHGVGQAVFLAGTLACRLVLLLRREHLAVVQQRFVHKRGQRLRAERERKNK